MMNPLQRNLSASQAAARLGISAKALRVYEQHGLIDPGRTAAGWRVYNPDDLERAGEIVALRTIGFSLAQIARALSGDSRALEAGLSAHETRLRGQARQLADALERVHALRSELRDGCAPDVARGLREPALAIGFALPWPWGGEWFELGPIGRLNFLTGPLGSGKTRLAERLAQQLPDATFLGLDRLCAIADAAHAERVERALAWLEEDGAERSDALRALVAALEATSPSILVVDLVEQGLDESSQLALIAHVRLRPPPKRALFLMTRSSAILDLDCVGADETILLCPANHSPPIRVVPCPGSRGYEAVATCLATPEVRSRTAGVIAVRARTG
jgi:DNA-binding transcriptional MerR regulator